ncbi:MAG: hypothetical protein ACE5EE_05925 [Fidelibacterota bacterium]
MKFVLLLFTISFILFFSGCKEDMEIEENITFSRTYGSSTYEEGHDVRQTDDSGYIVVGQTMINYERDVWLFKANEYGELLWERTFGGDLTDTGESIEPTTDGGYIIVASTDWNIWLIKTDENGIEE